MWFLSLRSHSTQHTHTILVSAARSGINDRNCSDFDCTFLYQQRLNEWETQWKGFMARSYITVSPEPLNYFLFNIYLTLWRIASPFHVCLTHPNAYAVRIIHSLHDELLLLSCVLPPHSWKLVSNATAFLHFYDDLCYGNDNKRIIKITRKEENTQIRIAYLNYFMACNFYHSYVSACASRISDFACSRCFLYRDNLSVSLSLRPFTAMRHCVTHTPYTANGQFTSLRHSVHKIIK